ncbi:MAG: branched-chain amino acid ABC transporter permease [Deltaproteobacteria bacterium]|nr:branched-chain amino acid ABC transporter permease [Deltaproteobacteria bacterium]
MFLKILINGFLLGGIFAVLSVGFSLSFGVARMLNMAHTAFYMLGAFLLFFSSSVRGVPLLPSALMAILITGFLGVLCYRFLFDRVKEQQTAIMIISVALALIFQEVLLLGFGGDYHRVPAFIPGFVKIIGTRVLYQQFFAIGAAITTLICLWLLLSKTDTGLAIRAVAQDRETANLAGIDVSRLCMITMGISITLSGIAGVVIAPIYMVRLLMWVHPLTIVLAAVVLGGMGSIKGSIVAAFILGFAETAVVFLIQGGSFLKGAVSLAVMVLVLLIKPEGLFGIVFEEERL